MVLTQGQRIQSFTLVDRVGDPNMGQVWVAQSDSGATVAMKCISEEFRENDDAVRRFWRECAFQMRLRHPGIVSVSECVQHEGDLFLVMQYIRGGSLEDRLRERLGNPLPLEETVSISSEILRALDYAHQQGVIHRDVKPSNILIENGRAYLTDFGVAVGMKARHSTSPESAGTYPYMSPEQILLDRQVDQRCDVYGFGCVLYEMLTGRPPFPLDSLVTCTDEQLREMHLNTPPVPPNHFNSSIPDRLNHVVLTALAKRPEDRFPGCGSFAMAIDGAVPRRVQAPASTSELSRANNFGILFVIWAVSLVISGNARNVGELTVVALFGFIASMPVLLRLLYRAWSSIQDSLTAMEPWKAIGLLLVPVFNFYWLWRALPAFADAYNSFIHRRHFQIGRESRVLYISFTAIAWIIAAAMLLPTAIVALVFILIELFVMIPLVVFALTGAINRLQIAQRSAQ